MVISDRGRETTKVGGEGEGKRKRKSVCEVKIFPKISDWSLLPSGVRIPCPVIYGVWFVKSLLVKFYKPVLKS